jgi:acetylornithine deacetylase/succinyl-diaminopimelate desuccinylase-like protein
VINRVRAMRFSGEHPLVGGRHAVVYQVAYAPLAPHTLPDTARISVDRRLLPGDDPDSAVEEVRQAIADLSPYEVAVERGTYMLPAVINSDAPIVQRLQAAHEAVLGGFARTYYSQGTYDAGGPCSRGVPAIMFGASAGDWPLGIDFVPLSQAVAEAKVVARLVLDTLC